MITGAAYVAGVVGNPISQSLSPVIHNAWLDAAGFDAAYVPFSCSEGDFERFVDGLRGTGLRGLNVTTPFKDRALRVADRRGPEAEVVGAANLLVFDDRRRVHAASTDGEGVRAALDEQAPGLAEASSPVVILGAGGAARSAAVELAGDREFRIVNRTVAKAERLAESVIMGGFGRSFRSGDQKAFRGAGLVINATSAGLLGGDVDLEWDALPRDAVVMDMTYKPLLTPLLAEARRRGHRIVDGLAMLIGQARPSFHILFDAVPSDDVDVRALCLRALGQAG